jgi:hypothetical protein
LVASDVLRLRTDAAKEFLGMLKTDGEVVSSRRLRLIAHASATVLLMLVWWTIPASSFAADLDAEVAFNIGAQPLDSALLEFSKQANTPVAFAAKSVGNLRTAGIYGKYVARKALSALLCNSGLAYTQVGGTVTVVPADSQNDTAPCGVPAIAKAAHRERQQ